MKRIRICACLLLIALLFLASCGDPYPPVKSTDEEARVVLRMKNGGKTYEARYELYRALALPLRDYYGSTAADRVDELKRTVADRILEIYTTLALCEELKIDLYDKSTDEQIDEYIRLDVEGDSTFEGYGSYDAYLAALREQYLNYATAELLLRYSIGLERLEAHYIGTYDYITQTYKDSALSFTDADVTAFYNDADTARVMLIELPREVYTDEQIALTREALINARDQGGESAVADWLLRYTYTDVSITRGELVTPYTLDNLFYQSVTDCAMALPEGEISDPIEVMSDELDSVYLVYRLDKPDTYLTDNRDAVTDTYRYHLIGRELARVRDALKASMTETDVLKNLDILSMQMK